MTHPRSVVLPGAAALLFLSTAFALPGRARAAEHAIIKNPGDHPHYVFEAEPHLTLGSGGPLDPGSPGIGFRGTFHITDGFVKSINDSIGVGFGIDFAGTDHLFVPVVMQWNFWLSTHWSAFGEPGFAVGAGPRNNLVPAFFAGGRYHFTEDIALTLRVGFPAIAVGVSFLL